MYRNRAWLIGTIVVTITGISACKSGPGKVPGTSAAHDVADEKTAETGHLGAEEWRQQLGWNDHREMAWLVQMTSGWPTDRMLTDKEWDRSIRIAGVLQQVAPKDLEAVLILYLCNTPLGSLDYFEYEAEFRSRPFMLLRVMFDLPDSAEALRDARRETGLPSWIPPFTSVNPRERENWSLSAPIRWSDSGPTLWAWRSIKHEPGSGDINLRHYQPHLEYRYFQSHFPFRDLDLPDKYKGADARRVLISELERSITEGDYDPE